MLKAMPDVQKDLTLLCRELGETVCRIAVFGSFLQQPEVASDIDIFIETQFGREQEVAERIAGLSLSVPVGRVDIQSYDKLIETKDLGLQYHFAVFSPALSSAFLRELVRRGGQCKFVEALHSTEAACG